MMSCDMPHRPFWATAVFLTCAGLCAGQSAQPTPQPTPPAATQSEAKVDAKAAAGAAIILLPEDEVRLEVEGVPDLNDKVFAIDLDGYINIPRIGRVYAAELKVEQFEAELSKRLQAYLNQPTVTAKVTRTKSRGSIQPIRVPTEAAGPAADAGKINYVLGAEDQIVIRAVNAPEITDKPIRVGTNGEINVPMIGRMPAAGMTTEQLESDLMKRLRVYYEEPQVSVSVSEFRRSPVSVLGRVTTPGVQQLQGPRTLLETLTLAGGVQTDAAPTLRITRLLEYGRVPLPGATDDPSGLYSVAEVEIKTIMDASAPEKNILVRPHDMIFVPKAEMVYVIGDVGRVGALIIPGQGVSVLQALSSSGGVLKTGSPKKAKILRPIMGGPKRAEVSVDVDKMMHGKANDQPLLPGDILFIPGSGTKQAALRAVNAAIQIGTYAGTAVVLR